MKLFLIPLAILNALWNIFIVAICIVVLCVGYTSYCIMEKIMSLLNWFKVLFFRATAMGGWCLATVLCAIGLCVPEMFGGKKDSEKSDRDQPKT